MRKIYALVAGFMFASLVNHSFAQVFLDEDFSSASGTTPPAGWSNNDIVGSGFDWAFDNPGFRTINSPMSDPAAIFDSDWYGGNAGEQNELISPVIDLSGATGAVLLEFDHYFRGGAGGAYSVEIFDGSAWQVVQSGTSSTANPLSVSINVTTLSNLASNFQVKFVWTGDWSWYWILDNVVVKNVTCPPPTTIAQTSLSNTSVGLSWLAGNSETDWNIEWGAPGFAPGTGAEIGSATATGTPSGTFGGLTANTNYQFYVQADCGSGDLSTWAGPFSIYTGYCTPAPTSVDNQGITNVTFVGINNTTVAEPGNYGDYTAMIANVQNGVTYPISVTITYTDYNMWALVDWNNDLDFNDAGEQYYVGNLSAGTPGTINIPVPVGATAGNHRLRVGGSDFNTTSPYQNVYACYAGSYGTYEDYTINVVVVNTPPAPIQAAGAPTCTAGTDLTVSGTPGTGETWYWQTSATGTSTANNATSPWTVFANGTYYVRAFNSTYGFWSTASSVAVSNFPLAATPAAPVAAANPACMSTTLTAGTPSSGTVYYWQTVMDGTDNTNNASTPLTVSASGTYYLAAYETASQCWSSTSSLAVTVSTYVPAAPTAPQSDYNICTGATTQPIVADAPSSGSVSVTYNGGDGPTDYNFSATSSTVSPCPTAISIAVPVGATITGVDVEYDMTALNNGYMSEQYSYLTCTSTGGVAEASITNGAGSSSGTYSYSRTNLPIANAVSSTGMVDFELHAFRAWGSSLETGCGVQYNKVDNGTLVLTVHYTFPVTTVSWYDAATAGANIGSGSPYESVGSAVLSNPATAGSYEFYAESVSGGCNSTSRTLITVNVNNVNQDFLAVDATCNNGDNGTFAISNTACGVAPFTYSVDGGTFGSIPTDLTTGTHTIQVKDGNGDLSAVYTITIGSAAAPDGAVVNAFDYDQADISWNAYGSETSWNVEWGAPGFTPGTGTEIGSATAIDTNYVITGLDGDTDYEIYISANCGGTTTAGDWTMTSVHTECDPIVTLPWCEDFETTSSYLQCWSNLDNDADGYTDFGYEYSQWTNWTNDDLGDPYFAHSGEAFATYFTQFNGTADDYLILPRMTLTGNEVLTFNYRLINPGSVNFKVLLSTTGKEAADFTEVLLADDYYTNDTEWLDTAVVINYAGEVFIAFVREETGPMTYTGLAIDDVCVDVCIPNPGVDGTQDVCRLDGTINLDPIITTEYPSGEWVFPANQSVVNGSTLNVSTLAAGTYDILYVKATACTADTTIATVTIYGPSSAGNDGTLNVCRNEPVNLLAGLTGNIDLGGDWYDPSNNMLSNSAIVANNVPGQYNYTYITGNGVCPDDTSSILVNVNSSCNYLNVEEMVFAEMTVYPNPSTGIFNIANESSTVFSYEVLDVEGRLVERKEAAVGASSVTSINMTDKVTGIYMIRVYNGEADKVFRVVLQ